MNDRRPGVSPDVPNRPQITLPQLVALVVITIKPGRSVPYHDMLAVRCRRRCAIRIGIMMRIRLLIRHRLGPKLLSVGSTEAVKTSPRPLRIFRTIQEDTI